MTAKRIYLSGPITGRPVSDYTAHFAKVQNDITDRAAAAGLDIQVINPVEEVEARLAGKTPPSWHMCMKVCVAILASCDGIAVLQGWEESKGARGELRLAGELGIPIVHIEPPVDGLHPGLGSEIFHYRFSRAEALEAGGLDGETTATRALIETIHRYLDPHGFEYRSEEEE